MKKIFMVIPSLGDGGGERLAINLSIKLVEKGFDVYLISLYKCVESVNYHLVKDNNLKLICLDKKKGLDYSLFSKIKKLFKEIKPDIIHTHLDTLLYVIPFLNKKHKKYHTIHSIAEKEAVGLQKIIRNYAFKIKKVVPVAICETVSTSISKYYNINKNEIPIVYNGINTKKYYKKQNTDNSQFTLINVGTLYEVKNQKFLINVFYEFNKKYPNSKLNILGEGLLRTELETQIAKMNLSNKVMLLGKVSNVEDYLATSDVFVMTSLFEGLPLSMIEAMACGLPIVSSNVGGIKDLIDEGKNGFLLNSFDIKLFVDKISLLFEDSLLLAKLSDNNIDKAKLFDFDNMTINYINLYLK